VLAPAKPQAASTSVPWAPHPSLTALQPFLRITADCWALLAAPDGTSRKEHYLPKGEREPDTAYRKRLDAARPSGFFRDALRTYAGMLSRGSWISLPASLSSVLTDVDGRGTDLGVFLAAADLLVLRDGAALVLVLPPEHSWPSEGDRQEALRCGDRLSLPRLQLVQDDQWLSAEALADCQAQAIVHVQSFGSGTLIRALQALRRGQTFLDPRLQARLQKPEAIALNGRERQTLAGLARGLTNKQIAQEHEIAATTVRDYVSSLCRQLGVNNRTQVVSRAIALGLTRERR
jgi:DNA-binding CsgD family transcriptional regulator